MLWRAEQRVWTLRTALFVAIFVLGWILSGRGDSADPISPERSQQALPSVTPKFVLNGSPGLKPYIHAASPSWADIVEAANGLRQQLGISRPGVTRQTIESVTCAPW